MNLFVNLTRIWQIISAPIKFLAYIHKQMLHRMAGAGSILSPLYSLAQWFGHSTGMWETQIRLPHCGTGGFEARSLARCSKGWGGVDQQSTFLYFFDSALPKKFGFSLIQTNFLFFFHILKLSANKPKPAAILPALVTDEWLAVARSTSHLCHRQENKLRPGLHLKAIST